MATADELLSECLIRVHGTTLAAAEPEVMRAVMSRITDNLGFASIEVFVTPRRENGWLEWSMSMAYKNGGCLHVGIIQRKPGVEIEYHS